MYHHLPVLPHPRLIAPLIAQPEQFVRFVPAYRVYFKESVDQAIRISAVLMEVHSLAERGPIVEC